MNDCISRALQKYLKYPSRVSNMIVTYTILLLATLISYLFFHFMSTPPSTNITLTYILALYLIARFTTGYFYGIMASVVGVVCVNFLFTFPYYALNFTLTGYPISFIVMLSISLFTSALTSNMKKQSEIIQEKGTLLIEAEKEKMRANLLRAISHDLRTPLTSIIGSSNVYLERSDSMEESEKRELVAHIFEDANWLINMVENLLSVTRINNDTTKVNKSMEPVEEVLSEAVLRLKKRLPNTQITVTIPDEFLMIPMDAVLIEQVIINLIENAQVHSKSKKPLTCYVDSDESYITFHIRDYGIGIPEEKLSTIFDGSSSTESEANDIRKGMGIGLSICKTIILAHNGIIEAINHEDGAEFYFKLPKEE